MKHELYFDPKLVRMSYVLKAHVIKRHELSLDTPSI